MKAKILLVWPYSISEDSWENKYKKPYPPLGICYIASYLKVHGFENDEFKLFDGTFHPGLESFEKLVDVFSPDIVGISTNTITENKSAQMIQVIKKKKEIPVILGGPGPSMDSRVVFKGGADCVVRGEGEEISVEVFNHYLDRNDSELENINGISFKKSNKVIVNSNRTFVSELGRIPFPDRDLIQMNDYRKMWIKNHGIFYSSIITARGCPYSCKWCARDLSFGRKYRHRPVEDIISEIKELKEKYNVDALRFVDDILTVHRKRSIDLFNSMLNHKVTIPFECLTRVDRVDEELLLMMKKAGLQLIYFGVESGSQRILNAMNKQIKVSQVYKTAKLMKKLGIQQSWFLMLGYPPEELKDIHKTIRTVRDLAPEKFGVSVAYPLPNTQFFQDLQENNKLLVNTDHWNHSLENKFLFKAKYSSKFYKWVIRALYLNSLTSKIQKSHNNTLTRFLDIGALTCSNLVLNWLAKPIQYQKRHLLENLPVEPKPVQC